MKRKYFFEAFLEWVIKTIETIIPKLKQEISDIFTLKYKKVTILLGTFVPFFVCYMLWYLPKEFVYRVKSKIHADNYEHVMRMKRYFFLVAIAFTLFLAAMYLSEISSVCSTNSFKFLAITGYLLVDLGINFILAQVFYKLFEVLWEDKPA